MKTAVYKVPAQTLRLLDVQTYEVLSAEDVCRVLKCEMDAPHIVEVWERATNGLMVIRVSDNEGRILYRAEGTAFDQMGLIGRMHNNKMICEYEDAETGDLTA